MALQMIYVDDASPGACGDAGIVYNGSTTLTSSKIIAGTSMTMSGTAAITGNTTMGGTAAVTGNTTVGGTLGVTGATTLTGAATCSDTLTVDGASTLTGNTAVGGTLTVTGESTFNSHINLGAGDDLIGSATSDIAFNTTAFTVAGATGNTAVGGTLAVTGATTLTGALQCNESVTIATTKNLIMTSDSDLLINTNKFTVAGSTGNTVCAGTMSVAEAFTASKAMIMSGAAVAAAHGAYAIPITNVYTGVTTDSTSELAATLADGAIGQLKIVKMTTKDTNNCVITPANFTDGTTITLDATGEIAVLMFMGTAWTTIYCTGTIA